MSLNMLYTHAFSFVRKLSPGLTTSWPYVIGYLIQMITFIRYLYPLIDDSPFHITFVISVSVL